MQRYLERDADDQVRYNTGKNDPSLSVHVALGSEKAAMILTCGKLRLNA